MRLTQKSGKKCRFAKVSPREMMNTVFAGNNNICCKLKKQAMFHNARALANPVCQLICTGDWPKVTVQDKIILICDEWISIAFLS